MSVFIFAAQAIQTAAQGVCQADALGNRMPSADNPGINNTLVCHGRAEWVSCCQAYGSVSQEAQAHGASGIQAHTFEGQVSPSNLEANRHNLEASWHCPEDGISSLQLLRAVQWLMISRGIFEATCHSFFSQANALGTNVAAH